MPYYERLSAQDASFLGLEDTNLHMHVGGVLVFESGPLRTADGGIDIALVRQAIEARLHLVPRYRQRLAYIPYEQHPVWVDDDRFHLAYHVRHTALPRPGDDQALKQLTGRIMSQPLDRSRPLWEMWCVEGLEGDRFALINKTHHCMIDGIAGADLMTTILSPLPDTNPGEPQSWQPRPRPSDAELVWDTIARRLSQPVEMLHSVSDAVHKPTEVIGRMRDSLTALAEALTPTLHSSSQTPLNVEVGPHRRFDWLEMKVADLKAVKNVCGSTLNDVVLAVVSGALRYYFAKKGHDPNRMKVRSMVPVSVRSQDERGAFGNRVAQMIAPLPVNLSDPVARLKAVTATMSGLKESKQALGAEVLIAISEWTVPNLLVQAMRLAALSRPYNLFVTNVPGPQIPLYFLGCPMQTVYPVVTLFENLGLAIGLFSFNGGLFWGLTADWEHFPDLHDLVEYIDRSFKDLQNATVQASEPRTSSTARVRRRQPRTQRAAKSNK